MTVLKFPIVFRGPSEAPRPVIKPNPAYPGKYFIVDMVEETIYCAECREECRHIPMPGLTIVWCPNCFCSNVLELRKKEGEPFELFSYGEGLEGFGDNDLLDDLVKSMEHPRLTE